jgi:hypothetical protein
VSKSTKEKRTTPGEQSPVSLTFTPLRYPQIWSPSPYFERSRKNSSTASLLYSLPRGSSTTGRASGLYGGVSSDRGDRGDYHESDSM